MLYTIAAQVPSLFSKKIREKRATASLIVQLVSGFSPLPNLNSAVPFTSKFSGHCISNFHLSLHPSIRMRIRLSECFKVALRTVHGFLITLLDVLKNFKKRRGSSHKVCFIKRNMGYPYAYLVVSLLANFFLSKE